MKKTINLMGCIAAFISLSACSSAMLATSSAGSTLNQQGRSFSSNVSDQTITYKATKAINDDPALAKSSRIVVVTFERNVLLTGETPTEQLKQQAEALVKRTPHIRHIYNDISVQPPLSTYEQGNDGIITGNIKTRMFTTTNLRGRNIKVITENDVVYLMGSVSQQEGRVAAEVARNSAGVKKVVKLFEYTS
ncbi:MAG: BON domain-containing protein [Gammaproteobacteria bacterium]|nr:BON domain-containing protein [Gammaproteobacteria bacterium]